jgi:hypothetical protein
MYVVYSTSGFVEALTVSGKHASLLANKKILKWMSWTDYVHSGNLYANEKFDESAYVIHDTNEDTNSPSRVQAIVKYPEMALDLILSNNEDGNKRYEWRIETAGNGLRLYIRSYNDFYWNLITAGRDQGSCRKTVDDLMHNFFWGSIYEWSLMARKLSEYIRIYNASLPKDKLHKWVPDYKVSSTLVLFNRDEESQSLSSEEESV